MKISIILSAFVVLTICSCEKEEEISQDKVPSVLRNTFQQRFPKVSDLDWEKEGAYYEAEFEIGSQEHEVLMDTNGVIVEYTQELEEKEVPETIRQSIEEKFPGYEMEEVERIEAKGQIQYKLELEKGSEETKIWLNDKGEIIEHKDK